MNFIADNADMVTLADIAHALQLVTMPHTTCGVMRIAKQENGGLLVGTPCLEICPVNLETVAAATELQYTLADLTTAVADAAEETVVVGTEHDNFLASHRPRL